MTKLCKQKAIPSISKQKVTQLISMNKKEDQTKVLQQWRYIDGLVQDCSNSTANALELLQSSTKPSICLYTDWLIMKNGSTSNNNMLVQNHSAI